MVSRHSAHSSSSSPVSVSLWSFASRSRAALAAREARLALAPGPALQLVTAGVKVTPTLSGRGSVDSSTNVLTVGPKMCGKGFPVITGLVATDTSGEQLARVAATQDWR